MPAHIIFLPYIQYTCSAVGKVIKISEREENIIFRILQTQQHCKTLWYDQMYNHIEEKCSCFWHCLLVCLPSFLWFHHQNNFFKKDIWLLVQYHHTIFYVAFWFKSFLFVFTFMHFAFIALFHWTVVQSKVKKKRRLGSLWIHPPLLLLYCSYHSWIGRYEWIKNLMKIHWWILWSRVEMKQ